MFPALRKLLPTGEAWRIATGSALGKVLDGISHSLERLVTFSDLAYLDLFAEYTRYIDEWSREYDLYPRVYVSDEAKRARVVQRRTARGGQTPYDMQTALNDAGFDVFVHECWETTNPYSAYDPRDYTTPPTVGYYRCGEEDSRCGSGARCGRLLNNNPEYWQTLMWRGEAPDPIPSDPDTWPMFVYICGQTFGSHFDITSTMWRELQRRIEQLKPAGYWVVCLANIVGEGDGIFDYTFGVEFE